jgi:hypothetical protein
MHPAQRKAIFAMVDSIENQCRYVKSLLAIDDQTIAAEETQRRPPARTTTGGSEYLDDTEEKQLEAEHEAARQEALKEHEARTQAEWSRTRQIVEEETPSPLLR